MTFSELYCILTPVNEEPLIRRRNAILYTLIEGDVLITDTGVSQLIINGEVLVFADGSLREIEVEYRTINGEATMRKHNAGSQVIYLSLLEPL